MNKQLSFFKILHILCIFFTLFLLEACDNNEPPSSIKLSEPINIRVGWQIPLATQGQIVQVLKNTDILKKHNLNVEFAGFSYGGPQSEAALAGELDVIFVGDQPVINLIARGGKWKIVSRLFYTRTAIMVPINSPVKSVADLKGKTVASPFGSVAHREAILKEQQAGLDADKDVKNIHLDILEISNLVQGGEKESWGKIDAITVWEPSTSLFELGNYARVLSYTPTLGVTAMSDDILQKHPKAAKALLQAIREAWIYFAKNTKQVNKWYIKDARLAYTLEVLDSAAKVEPNYGAKNIRDINLEITPEHIKTLKAGAKWSFERGYAVSEADIEKGIYK